MHTDSLEIFCRDIGFELFGVTDQFEFSHHKKYKRWISQKFHAEMEYLSTKSALEKRKSLKNILPTIKSVIALGFRYPVMKNEDFENAKNIGKISAYACGKDYHIFLIQKLRLVVELIRNQYEKEVNSRIYTDTGPILERELGVKAGLGWIGKNSFLINKRFGSFFFLSEILLDVEIRPTSKFKYFDHCGDCRLCIETCPTQCIQEDRTIDANRCISYLTIENQKEIPLSIKENISNNIFGCDQCQVVCPWNKEHINETIIKPDFQDIFVSQYQDLNSLKNLTEEEFQNLYQKTPVSRAKYKGFMRNVATANYNKKRKK